MATRDVDSLEIWTAERDGWARRFSGDEWLHRRELGDGRTVYLRELLFGSLALSIGRHETGAYDQVWAYDVEQSELAWRAALGWDGEGEPEGWYRHYAPRAWDRPAMGPGAGGPAARGTVTAFTANAGAAARRTALVRCSDMAAPPDDLPELLRLAIARGLLTEAQARDVDAFADGIASRGASGDLTAEQADEITARRALADGTAELRARARRQGNAKK